MNFLCLATVSHLSLGLFFLGIVESNTLLIFLPPPSNAVELASFPVQRRLECGYQCARTATCAYLETMTAFDGPLLCTLFRDPFYTYREIASGKPCAQSSVYCSNFCPRAVDGNTANLFSLGSCSETKFESNPWWRVDLLGIYKITSVTVYNRGDCCSERLHNLSIGSLMTLNSTEAICQADIPYIPHQLERNFKCGHRFYGRFVVISLKSTNLLTLCEVKVFS